MCEDAFAKRGGKKPNWNLYKVPEYLNMNKYSFYETEVTMSKNRLKQPSNKKPDVMPQVKIQPQAKTQK
nr:Protein Y69A2AR.3 [Haemonchus contortus]